MVYYVVGIIQQFPSHCFFFADQMVYVAYLFLGALPTVVAAIVVVSQNGIHSIAGVKAGQNILKSF